jgi:cellulose synthase/poly-beta-1,6-N-acetylglucosamine synthase-like glycosyltransferase
VYNQGLVHSHIMMEIADTRRMLSIVMPVYNEEATLARIVRQVLQVPNLLETGDR